MSQNPPWPPQGQGNPQDPRGNLPPQQGGGYPQGGYPRRRLPPAGVATPQGGYPQGGYPPQGVVSTQQGGYPPQGAARVTSRRAMPGRSRGSRRAATPTRVKAATSRPTGRRWPGGPRWAVPPQEHRIFFFFFCGGRRPVLYSTHLLLSPGKLPGALKGH